MIVVEPKELFDFFQKRGVKYFFHANTVKTSCAMIMQGGLVSRGYMEKHNLPMTTQSSDEKDKEFNVWNDIFLDIVDLHEYFGRENYYGPVCFKISNEILLDAELPNICITKNNPIYWVSEMTEKDRYYESVEEYALGFESSMKDHSIQRKMFTIRNTDFKVLLKKYLVEIVLDNPGVLVNQEDLFSKAKEALGDAIDNVGGDREKLKIRRCTNCYCRSNYYNQNMDVLRKSFLL